MRLSKIGIVTAAVAAGCAALVALPQSGTAQPQLTKQQIIDQNTDRLLNVIYPGLIAQDADGISKTFYHDENEDGSTTVGDGYFLFQQPSGDTNQVVASPQGRADIKQFLSAFFANVKPCSFDLHEDSLLWAVDTSKPAVSFFFTQTATVVFPNFGGSCANESTHYTWVMDITRNEVKVGNKWLTLSDHNVLRSSTPPLP